MWFPQGRPEDTPYPLGRVPGSAGKRFGAVQPGGRPAAPAHLPRSAANPVGVAQAAAQSQRRLEPFAGLVIDEKYPSPAGVVAVDSFRPDGRLDGLVAGLHGADVDRRKGRGQLVPVGGAHFRPRRLQVLQHRVVNVESVIEASCHHHYAAVAARRPVCRLAALEDYQVPRPLPGPMIGHRGTAESRTHHHHLRRLGKGGLRGLRPGVVFKGIFSAEPVGRVRYLLVELDPGHGFGNLPPHRVQGPAQKLDQAQGQGILPEPRPHELPRRAEVAPAQRGQQAQNDPQPGGETWTVLISRHR